MADKCILQDRDCINCGECDICDLNPNKRCDDCGKCLESDVDDYRSVYIEDFLKQHVKMDDKGNIKIDESTKDFGDNESIELDYEGLDDNYEDDELDLYQFGEEDFDLDDFGEEDFDLDDFEEDESDMHCGCHGQQKRELHDNCGCDSHKEHCHDDNCCSHNHKERCHDDNCGCNSHKEHCHDDNCGCEGGAATPDTNR